MLRLTQEEACLRMAEVLAVRSTCSRLAVGALVTDPAMTNIYAMAYNGAARGLANGCETQTPGACGCCHAEMNALVKAPTDRGA